MVSTGSKLPFLLDYNVIAIIEQYLNNLAKYNTFAIHLQ
jgi:hypothetical protein